MEPLTIITTALTLATPYLIKAGESISGKVGEYIWNIIKKPFSEEENLDSEFDIENEEHKKNITSKLLNKIELDETYKDELENAILKANNVLKNENKQVVQNNEKIEKQINIQNNNGSINM